MIHYWPHEPSIELQQSVAKLLSKTKQKLKNNLCNKTYFYLYTDILDDFHKERILRIITKELENLILDLIEMNISIKEINSNQTKILFYLINKSLNKISQEMYIKINSEFYKINISSKTLTHDNILLYYLLIYFLFGSSYIESHIFGFNPKETPQEHVKILCENLIIQISNLITYQLLHQIKNISELTFFIHKNFLCNNTYISNRSIALFLNTLLIQNFIHFYINQTRIIYNNRYCVFLLSTKGIIKIYLYT
uniref:Uncharacterized protein n=1 Tax=Wrangelia sp. TaxID=2575620 RepID=A0A4D6X5F7_9FLOR|nr:hypothetical protein [Wrangelia sp.]